MTRYLAPIPLLIISLALLVGVSITMLFDRTANQRATRDASRQYGVQRSKQALGAAVLFGTGLFLGQVLFGSLIIAAPFAALLAATPSLINGAKRQRTSNAITQAWPDAIDHLSSAIRAGLNLGDSLAAIGLRGPAPLRPFFIALGNDLAAGTPIETALARFRVECRDPIADQLVETVLIAHEVGGSEIGRLLRTFSQFLRIELQTRDEIRVRQGWVINGARIAVAAPWILLALLSLRRESVLAYQTTGGIFVIVIGALLSVVAYLWMRRLARLGIAQS
ncbi:bacterial type II secretion system protein F domain protein [mine drainage metagenome]|uniref:Bacterial type II secretion system protein F domain protein n=1 Tax=mine drainage metagenome TaxID=410659 RepID=A0A1J5Q408_9ZZZZ